MPKRIITAYDLEMIASLGKKDFFVEDNDVVTDIARERAAQLGINLLKHPIEGPVNKGAVKTETKPPLPQGNPQLNSFQEKLEQLQQEIARIKADNISPVANSPLAGSSPARAKDPSLRWGTATWASSALAGSSPVSAGVMTVNDREAPAAEADLVIKNGNLVMPRLGVFRGDLEIQGRKIKAISRNAQTRGKKTIDATGLYVLPGVMDPHVHLGIFGNIEEEMEKETASALLGGITTAGCFLYSEDSYFDCFPSFIEMVEQRSYIDIFPHLIITTPRQVEEIPSYIEELKITSFKVFMCGIPGIIPNMSDDRMLDVFEKVKGYRDVSISIHAENPHIIERFSARHSLDVKQENDLLSWSKTRPALAEEEAVKRALLLARSYGVNIYLVHLSARESINALRDLRDRKGAYKIYAETTSPYLTVDTSWNLGALGKMIPPFRPSEHRESLWEAVREGIIDTVGTDNATLTLEEKKVKEGMWEALPGYPALATHLPSLLDEGVNKGRIDLVRLAELTSLRPAEIFGLYPAKGSLLPDSDADIVIVDLQKCRKVDPLKLGSRSDFSLYMGRELKGWPVYTVKSGEISMEAGELPIKASKIGMVIRRNPGFKA